MTGRGDQGLHRARVAAIAVTLGAVVVASAAAGIQWLRTHAHDDHGHHHGGGGIDARYDVNDPAQVASLGGPDAPTLSMTIRMAADRSWDLGLDVANFRFSDGHGARTHVPGEGYARLHVNGEHRGDIRRTGHRLEPLATGVHEITVNLVTNDHRAYAREGRLVADRVVLRVGRSPKGADPSARKVFSLVVTDGQVVMTGDTIRVRQGDEVELRWSSDRRLSLHVHGYDVEATVSADSPVVMLFQADLPGRFPVSEHRDDGAPERAALYLEVHP